LPGFEHPGANRREQLPEPDAVAGPPIWTGVGVRFSKAAPTLKFSNNNFFPAVAGMLKDPETGQPDTACTSMVAGGDRQAQTNKEVSCH